MMRYGVGRFAAAILIVLGACSAFLGALLFFPSIGSSTAAWSLVALVGGALSMTVGYVALAIFDAVAAYLNSIEPAAASQPPDAPACDVDPQAFTPIANPEPIETPEDRNAMVARKLAEYDQRLKKA